MRMSEITKEQLDRMSLPEKVSQHAKDVMKTENNPRFLKMNYQFIGGPLDGEHQAQYLPKEGQYIYDFLFGGGSLGHFLNPTITGEGVIKVAELVGTGVSFLDFTFARFGMRINQEAIERAFYPIWEMSDKLHALPQLVDQSVVEQYIQKARLNLSQIKFKPE